MLSITAAALVAANLTAFTTYPAFGDRKPAVPRGAVQPRVEAAIDKGLMLELIVRCGRGTAVVQYSKVERVYCAPGGRCRSQLSAALGSLCR